MPNSISAEDARKFQHTAEPGTQGLGRGKQDVRGKAAQAARRRAPPASSQSDGEAGLFASSYQRCGAFFLESPQFVCEAYDHIEIPPIVPHVTRVSLLGGACLCCARKFKAEPPQDMPKDSPFGPNLRALVIYLRFTQGIAFERLATLLSDLLGLDISEGALVNILDAAKMPLPRRPRRSAQSPRWYDPAIRRDRPAGRQAELVAVGFPS